MADHERHRPDDELGPDAFDGLDLDTLADGVHPTTARWREIESSAATRRQRRTWLVAAAAAAVLLLAVGTIVAARSGDDAVDIAAGGDGAEDLYLLPPSDATGVEVHDDGPQGSSIRYTDRSGNWWVLRRNPLPVVAGSEGELMSGPELVAAWRGSGMANAIRHERLGILWSGCTVGWADSVSTQVTQFGGPAWVGTLDSVAWTYLEDATAGVDRGQPGPCVPGEPTAALLDQLDGLRIVDAEEFRRYLEEHGAVAPVDTSAVVPSTTPDTAIATLVDPGTGPEDPPADRASAEEQIAAAVAGLAEVAADGSYPNLEDGVTRAEEYRAAIELAGQQAGGDQVPDAPATVFALTSAHFTSPTRATITYSSTATLPTGTYTFTNAGEALLQDGHWVVSYDTIRTMLARACTPPGGQSTACGAGG